MSRHIAYRCNLHLMKGWVFFSMHFNSHNESAPSVIGDIKEEFENGRIGDMIPAEKLATYYFLSKTCLLILVVS